MYESSAEGWLQFAVWLSVAVFVTVYLLLFLFLCVYKQNRFEQFLLQQSPERPKKVVVVVEKLEHTRKEPFSLKTRLFPSSLGFFFSQTFCSVFVTLIILTCYLCMCVFVCECVGVVCLLEKQTTISKNSSSWVRKTVFVSHQHQYSI